MNGDPQDRYPSSWYAATRAAGPIASALEGARKAEVCIVGGGYSGLGAALRLAERGVDAVLLEAGPIGWGASGRNGGQMHVGMRQTQSWLERKVGRDDPQHLWRIAIDARNHLDALVAEHAIDCDLHTVTSTPHTSRAASPRRAQT